MFPDPVLDRFRYLKGTDGKDRQSLTARVGLASRPHLDQDGRKLLPAQNNRKKPVKIVEGFPVDPALTCSRGGS